MSTGAGCAKAFAIAVISIGGLGLLGLIGLVVLNMILPDRSTPATASSSPTRATAKESRESKLELNRRLFLQEVRWDDSVRGDIFRKAIRGSGARCDAVDKMLLTGPGTWTVRCSPGHVFTLRFDKDAELKEIGQAQ